MKKSLRAAVLAFMLLACGMQAFAEDPVDLVIVLDSSQSMFQYYGEVVEYLVSSVVTQYLRFGDNFHLLSFSDTTQIEIAQKLETEQDVKGALARLYLLYPLGKYTDLIGALQSTYEYADDLPESTRKFIILVTDGMHNPAASSVYAALDAEGVRANVEARAAKIRERGWELRIVRVPFGTGAAVTGSGETVDGGVKAAGDYLAAVAKGAGTPIAEYSPGMSASAVDATILLPKLTYPSDLGKKDYSFRLRLQVQNPSASAVTLETAKLLLGDGTDVLAKRAFLKLDPGATGQIDIDVRLPDSMEEGMRSISLEPLFANGLRVVPAKGEMRIELERSLLGGILRNGGMIVVFFLLLALIFLALFVAVRLLRSAHSKTREPVVNAFLDSASSDARSTESSMAAYANRERADRKILDSTASAATGSLLSRTTEDANRSRDILAEFRNKNAAAETGLPLARAEKREHARFGGNTPMTVQGSADDTLSRAASLLASYSDQSDRPKLALAKDVVPHGPVATSHGKIQYAATVKKPGTERIELRVEGQNRAIGTRNIKTLHSGGKKTVGGGRSDFLVFLFPVPSHVAELHFDGENATLVPLKPEYFPEIEGVLHSCIGREIAILGKNGRRMAIRFERYTPPADKINKLLHCIDMPGLFFETLFGDSE